MAKRISRLARERPMMLRRGALLIRIGIRRNPEPGPSSTDTSRPTAFREPITARRFPEFETTRRSVVRSSHLLGSSSLLAGKLAKIESREALSVNGSFPR
jgi:hypothetical protein